MMPIEYGDMIIGKLQKVAYELQQVYKTNSSITPQGSVRGK